MSTARTIVQTEIHVLNHPDSSSTRRSACISQRGRESESSKRHASFVGQLPVKLDILQQRQLQPIHGLQGQEARHAHRCGRADAAAVHIPGRQQLAAQSVL